MRYMNKILFIFLLFLIVSCEKENAIEKEIAAIPITLEVDRFDQSFLGAKPSDLPSLKERYPMFFPESIPDSVWVYTIKDTLQITLKSEIDNVFSDFKSVTDDVKAVLQHVKYYFPEYKFPKVYTLTSEDYRKKTILTSDMLLIPLNLYLGETHEFYEGIPKYLVQTYHKDQIAVDVANEFASSVVPQSRDRSFLAKMIYFGKLQYVKRLFVPFKSEAQSLEYTEDQLAWAMDNEDQIWRYFVERKLLYSTDPKLDDRFLRPGPFSKFYLELDNESPGRLGQFTGERIVSAFMKNNDVSLRDMLKMKAEELFTKSKYKPRK